MHCKKRVLEERPNAKIRRYGNGYGRDLFVVHDGPEVLELGNANYGPKGAWRDAYYFLVRRKHARKLAHEARRK